MSTPICINIDDSLNDTILTSGQKNVDIIIRSFLSNVDNKNKIIGLDTEWTVNEKQKNRSDTAILVLCDGKSCLIFQLSIGIIPKSLANFLRLSDYTFVGMGIKSSLLKLEKDYGLGCKNSVELGPLAAQIIGNPKLSAYGVDKLALEVDSLTLQRPTCVVFKDWGNDLLNKKQIKFVTLNAYAYFRIGNKLMDYQFNPTYGNGPMGKYVPIEDRMRATYML